MSYSKHFIIITVLLVGSIIFFYVRQEKPMHVVVALPFKANQPLDPHWYTEDYVNYISDLLPEKQFHVDSYFVSLDNIPQFLNDMQKLHREKGKLCILNMCDGGEQWDGYPGISVCKLWEAHPINGAIPKSGADYEFILNSDDKVNMQKCLRKANLDALPELLVDSNTSLEKESLMNQLNQAGLQSSWPLFCKLNIGAGATGITDASICHNIDELLLQLQKMKNLVPNGNYVIQPYLPGPEYTVLIIGNRVYAAVQRNFHNSYNIMYEDYLSDSRNIENEISYSSAPMYAQDIALKALKAIPGRHHYTRVDLRDDGQGHTFVIDINERPGFGNPSTVKSMLDFHHLSEADLLREIIDTCIR